MTDKIVLCKVTDKDDGMSKLVRLQKRRVVIGSAMSSDLVLGGKAVSPVHAILEISGTDGRPVIYDLASDSGLSVNGFPTVQQTLGAGDKVTIGNYQIEFDVQSVTAPSPSQAPRAEARSFSHALSLSEKEMAPLLLEDDRNVEEIFDYRPESKSALQVVMFFNDTILDVEHFVKNKRIVIGPGTAEDFGIPPFLGEGKKGRFELVTKDKTGRSVLHLHEKMNGVIHHEGKMISVKDILSSGDSLKDFPLAERDFAKVSLGDVSFFMNYSPAPPRLKSRRIFERDPLFLRIFITSLLMTAAILFGVSSVVVNPQVEIEELPERIATIILEPKNLPVERPPVPVVKEEPKQEEKPKVEPTPKVIKIDVKPQTTPAVKNGMIDSAKTPQKAQKAAPKNTPRPTAKPKAAAPGGGQEGEGAKAKGAEGMRGKQNAPKSATPQDKALRPGEGKPTNGPAANQGHSQTDSLGVVDVFKSNQGALSKILAGGKGASNAASKLEGYSGFTTQGKGGLGAAGTGSGGGGESMGLGGLSNKGFGGGKKGTGLGALGSGGSILGGTGKLAISGGGSTEPIVLGAIDTGAIAREIAKHLDEIKYCYEKEINAENPDLAGKVAIRFVIGASGGVTHAGVSTTTLKNAATESCVVDVIKRIQFPPVRGGGTAEVTYPFVFKPSNR